MKKINTAVARSMGKIEGQRLTIGLDSGSRMALETLMHSPADCRASWVIVALARNVRLIGRVGDKLIGRARGPCRG